MSSSESCPFQVSCPIYSEFQGYQRRMYVSMYCNDHFDLCARHRLRLKGKTVPANLAPNGLFLIPSR